jgi:hypothetical protein
MLRLYQLSVHACTAEEIKPITHNDTVDTLEAPVWGKPAKRGALFGFLREGAAANIKQKILTV